MKTTAPDTMDVPPVVGLGPSGVKAEQQGVWCREPIKAGTIFGPFVGDRVPQASRSMDGSYVWEILDQGTGELLFYLDATDPAKGNWLRHVNCANNQNQQNLTSIQDDIDIYFKATKDIRPGDELLTWYEKTSNRRGRTFRHRRATSMVRSCNSPVESAKSQCSPVSQNVGHALPSTSVGPPAMDHTEQATDPHKTLEGDSVCHVLPATDHGENMEQSNRTPGIEVGFKVSQTQTDQPSVRTVEEECAEFLVRLSQSHLTHDGVLATENRKSPAILHNSLTHLPPATDGSDPGQVQASGDRQTSDRGDPGLMQASIERQATGRHDPGEMRASGESYANDGEHPMLVQATGVRQVREGDHSSQVPVVCASDEASKDDSLNYQGNREYDVLPKQVWTDNVSETNKRLSASSPPQCDIVNEGNAFSCLIAKHDEDASAAEDGDDEDAEEDVESLSESLASITKSEDSTTALSQSSEPGKFGFELKPSNNVKGRMGKRMFKCDVCSGIYRHAFSLKRHFIRTHVNSKYVTQADMLNCQVNPAPQKCIPSVSMLQLIKARKENSQVAQPENELYGVTQANAVANGHKSDNNSGSHVPKGESITCDILDNRNIDNQNMCDISDETTNPSDEQNKSHTISTVNTNQNAFETDSSTGDIEYLAEEYLDIGSEEMLGLYRCNICSQLYDTVEELRDHIANHPDVPNMKAYSCDKCEMKFSHKQNLMRHQAVHTGAKPFSCKVCGKKFPTATNKKRHERIHDGRRIPCDYCSSTFTQTGDLKKHIRKLHPECFFECAFCGKYYNNEMSLGMHLRTHDESMDSNVMEGSRLKQSFHYDIDEDRAESMRLGELRPGSKFACTICKKKFQDYANMCRHRRLAHQRHLLISKKSTEGNSSCPSPVGSDKCDLDPQSYFYANVARNIAENLNYFVDGQQEHIENSEVYINWKNSIPDEQDIPELKTEMQNKTAQEQENWRLYNFPPGFEPQMHFLKELKGEDAVCQNGIARTVLSVPSFLTLESAKANATKVPPASYSPARHSPVSHSPLSSSPALSINSACKKSQPAALNSGSKGIKTSKASHSPIAESGASSPSSFALKVPDFKVCSVCRTVFHKYDTYKEHMAHKHKINVSDETKMDDQNSTSKAMDEKQNQRELVRMKVQQYISSKFPKVNLPSVSCGFDLRKEPTSHVYDDCGALDLTASIKREPESGNTSPTLIHSHKAVKSEAEKNNNFACNPMDILYPNGKKYVCAVCHHDYLDLKVLKEHQREAHPYVHCSHVEVDASVGTTLWQMPNPVGMLNICSSQLPASSETPSVKGQFSCTKCGQSFDFISDLHGHIVECAAHSKETKPFVRPVERFKFSKGLGRVKLSRMRDKPTSPVKTAAMQKVLKAKRAVAAMQEHHSLARMPLRRRTQRAIWNSKHFAGESIQDYLPTSRRRRRSSMELLYNPLNHVRRREMTEVLDMHKCRGCGYRFSSISLLERHIKVCTQKERMRDIQVMKPSSSVEDHSRQYTCIYCMKTFTYCGSLKKHISDICAKRKARKEKGQPIDHAWERRVKQWKPRKGMSAPDCADYVETESRPRKRKGRRKNHKWGYIKKKRSETNSPEPVETLCLLSVDDPVKQSEEGIPQDVLQVGGDDVSALQDHSHTDHAVSSKDGKILTSAVDACVRKQNSTDKKKVPKASPKLDKISPNIPLVIKGGVSPIKSKELNRGERKKSKGVNKIKDCTLVSDLNSHPTRIEQTPVAGDLESKIKKLAPPAQTQPDNLAALPSYGEGDTKSHSDLGEQLDKEQQNQPRAQVQEARQETKEATISESIAEKENFSSVVSNVKTTTSEEYVSEARTVGLNLTKKPVKSKVQLCSTISKLESRLMSSSGAIQSFLDLSSDKKSTNFKSECFEADDKAESVILSNTSKTEVSSSPVALHATNLKRKNSNSTVLKCPTVTKQSSGSSIECSQIVPENKPKGEMQTNFQVASCPQAIGKELNIVKVNGVNVNAVRLDVLGKTTEGKMDQDSEKTKKSPVEGKGHRKAKGVSKSKVLAGKSRIVSESVDNKLSVNTIPQTVIMASPNPDSKTVEPSLGQRRANVGPAGLALAQRWADDTLLSGKEAQSQVLPKKKNIQKEMKKLSPASAKIATCTNTMPAECVPCSNPETHTLGKHNNLDGFAFTKSPQNLYSGITDAGIQSTVKKMKVMPKNKTVQQILLERASGQVGDSRAEECGLPQKTSPDSTVLNVPQCSPLVTHKSSSQLDSTVSPGKNTTEPCSKRDSSPKIRAGKKRTVSALLDTLGKTSPLLSEGTVAMVQQTVFTGDAVSKVITPVSNSVMLKQPVLQKTNSHLQLPTQNVSQTVLYVQSVMPNTSGLGNNVITFNKFDVGQVTNVLHVQNEKDLQCNAANLSNSFGESAKSQGSLSNDVSPAAQKPVKVTKRSIKSPTNKVVKTKKASPKSNKKEQKKLDHLPVPDSLVHNQVFNPAGLIQSPEAVPRSPKKGVLNVPQVVPSQTEKKKPSPKPKVKKQKSKTDIILEVVDDCNEKQDNQEHNKNIAKGDIMTVDEKQVRASPKKKAVRSPKKTTVNSEKESKKKAQSPQTPQTTPKTSVCSTGKGKRSNTGAIKNLTDFEMEGGDYMDESDLVPVKRKGRKSNIKELITEPEQSQSAIIEGKGKKKGKHSKNTTDGVQLSSEPLPKSMRAADKSVDTTPKSSVKASSNVGTNATKMSESPDKIQLSPAKRGRKPKSPKTELTQGGGGKTTVLKGKRKLTPDSPGAEDASENISGKKVLKGKKPAVKTSPKATKPKTKAVRKSIPRGLASSK